MRKATRVLLFAPLMLTTAVMAVMAAYIIADQSIDDGYFYE